MTQHVKDLIPLYHDGELNPAEIRMVENHLESCPDCRRELQKLQDLSSLLQKSPVPQFLTGAEQFAGNVNLRLARRKKEFNCRTLFEILWHAVPWGILGSLAFLHVLMLIVMFVSLFLLAPVDLPAGLPEMDLGTNPFWVFLQELLLDPGGLQPGLAELLGLLGFTGQIILLNLIIPLVFITIYLSWFAGWFLRKKAAQTAAG